MMSLSLGAVVVVGAGMSIASRFPDTRGLTALLWDALDSDVEARSRLATAIGRKDTEAKVLVGDSWSDVVQAWKYAADGKVARRRFQEQFASLDRKRSTQPSVAHEALARLIHAGVIECVVSLNWDTALEHAYSRLYGTDVPNGVLFKPHGDAAEPQVPWVLPHDSGVVPHDLIETITQLRAGHARALLVAGYSERDDVIVERLLTPLDKSWRAIRIGPHAHARDDIQGRAEDVLPLLSEPYALKEDLSSWHPVTFTGQRGVDSWLEGHRLGPQDVEACPELQEVEILAQSLSRDRAIVLTGLTGSGKSISAYQALRLLARTGYEVLRLRESARRQSVRQWLADMAYFPHRKVLFVDDAQDLAPDTVRELTEAATTDQLVLIVGIDQVAGGAQTYQLSARGAVTRLARLVREDRAKIFPHVRQLDPNVGGHPSDLQFDMRIDIAEREETPWQFTYVLTGGWRRVRRQALELRDKNRADLALLLVAVAQVAGVDSGVPKGELETLAGLIERDDCWLTTALGELRKRRLVSECDGYVRCSHLQAAFTIIAALLHPPEHRFTPHARVRIPPIASAPRNEATDLSDTGPSIGANTADLPRVPGSEVEADRETVARLFERVLASSATPLQGCAWLIGSSLDSEARWLLGRKGVLTAATFTGLALRALAVVRNGDIGSAAHLLTTTINYSDGAVLDTVRGHASRLAEWLEVITPENAWALGNLVSSLHQPDPEFAAEVAQFSDSDKLASLVLEGGWSNIYSTASALDRIVNVGGAALRDEVARRLDREAYETMLNSCPPDLGHYAELIEGIAAADHSLSLHLFRCSVSRTSSLLQVDLVRRWNELFGLVFDVLGYGYVAFGRGGQLPAKCRSAARLLMRALDRQRVAEALAGPQDLWEQVNLGIFVELMIRSAPEVFADVANHIDYADFASSLSSPPGRPSRIGLYVCGCLWERKPDEVGRILDSLEPKLLELDSRIAFMAPDVAARALRRGVPLDLELDNNDWGFASEVVERVAVHDHTLAREVVHANRIGMLEGLSNKASDPFEGLNSWVTLCDGIDPHFVDSVIAELPKGAISTWDRAIKRPRKREKWRRREITPLVHRAAALGGYVQREAEALLLRFPSLTSLGR